MHLQPGNANKEARAAKLLLLVVIAQNVTDILAKKTFNAFTELLHSIDLTLIHLPLDVRARSKRWDLSIDFIIPRHVRDQVLDYGKRFHRLKRNRLVQRQSIHASLASQTGPAVHFCRTRATL